MYRSGIISNRLNSSEETIQRNFSVHSDETNPPISSQQRLIMPVILLQFAFQATLIHASQSCVIATECLLNVASMQITAQRKTPQKTSGLPVFDRRVWRCLSTTPDGVPPCRGDRVCVCRLPFRPCSLLPLLIHRANVSAACEDAGVVKHRSSATSPKILPIACC